MKHRILYMERKISRLSELRHKFSHSLYPETLIHGCGELRKVQSGNKNVPIIKAIFANKQENTSSDFFFESIPVEALSLLRRGDIYDEYGILYKKDEKRTQKCEISFTLTADNKPQALSTFLTPTNNEKYKALSDEFFNQWAMGIIATNAQGESERVIIPCTAIASFYLPHSCLLRAALSGEGFGANSVLVNQRLTEEGGKLLQNHGHRYVHLHKTMYDIVAPHVARIYYSDIAKKAFNAIHEHSMQIPLPSGVHSLYCRPFVEGPLTWEVQGQHINDERLGSIFLVSQISACNGAFPFSSLTFGRENDNRGTRAEKTQTKKLTKVISTSDTEDEAQDNEDDTGFDSDNSDDSTIDNSNTASDEIETVHIVLDSEDAMCTALSQVAIRKIEKVTCKTRTLVEYTGDAVIQGLSFIAGKNPAANSPNQAGKHQLLAKIDAGRISTISSKKIRDEPDCSSVISTPDLADTYKLLQNLDLPNMSISLRRIKPNCSSYNSLSKDENVVPVEYRDLGGKDNWVMLQTLRKKERENESLYEQVQRCRKFIIVQIKKNDNFGYLVAFEREKEDSIAGLFFSRRGERLTPNELKAEILLNVKNRRDWRKNSSMTYKRKLVHNAKRTIKETDIIKKTEDELYIEKVTDCINDVGKILTC